MNVTMWILFYKVFCLSFKLLYHIVDGEQKACRNADEKKVT